MMLFDNGEHNEFVQFFIERNYTGKQLGLSEKCTD